jgi:hypothetical protein
LLAAAAATAAAADHPKVVEDDRGTIRFCTDSSNLAISLSPAAAAAIADHLKAVEGQALAMLAQNERLEKRMMALEQHVQVGADMYMYQRCRNILIININARFQMRSA